MHCLKWVLVGIALGYHLIEFVINYPFVIKYKKRLIGSKFEKFFEVFFDKILVKRLLRLSLPRYKLASKLTTSSANENLSWTVNSLTVKYVKIGARNFARLYVGVTIADIKTYILAVISA